MTNAFPEDDGANDESRESLEPSEQLNISGDGVSDPRDQGDQTTTLAEDPAPTPLNPRTRRTGQRGQNQNRQGGSHKKAPKRALTPSDEPVNITLARAEVSAASATQTAHADEAASDSKVALLELEAQGFTEDEALRLITISGRLASSREARESQATLRRLRFTRWLIDRGILDEFSA